MSAFYDQSSLVFLPSGYKDGKLYSQKPLSTSGELSFSRGSDIEATRIGADGLIHKAQVNLLLQSNSFDTTWVGSSASVTSGQSGYDGSSDAWLLDSSAGYLYQSISATGVHTISVYVKAGTAEGFRIRVDQATDANYIIDLSDGSLISQSDNIAYKSTSVGGGWYRMEMAFLANTITNIQFRITDLAGATASGTAYIQDAQLNYGLVAQDYQETTTAAVVNGITDNMPRLNYDPANPTCPSLLLEPSATAINQDSENFSGSYWTKGDLTVEQNTSETLDPSGNYSASKLTETATTARHRLLSGAVTMAAVSNTSSVFLKKGTARYGFVTMSGAATSTIVVDLEDGTITDTSSSGTIVAQKVEDYGSGWYRISVTALGIAGSTSANLQFGSAGSATPSYTANIPSFAGSTSNYLYAWGANLTNTGYLQSYIPTYGSSATRTSESCSKTGIASLIGQTQGTIYFEVEQSNTSGVNGAWSISDGSSTNRITMNTTNDTSTNFTFSVAANYAGSGTVLMSADATYAGTHKVAIKYSGTSMKLFVDGSEVDSATTTGFGNYTNYYLGANQVGGGASETRNFLQGLLFTSALSDADCITLTSL